MKVLCFKFLKLFFTYSMKVLCFNFLKLLFTKGLYPLGPRRISRREFPSADFRRGNTIGGQILNIFNTESRPTVQRIGRRLWRIDRWLYYPRTHTPIVEESALESVLESTDYSSKLADSNADSVWKSCISNSPSLRQPPVSTLNPFTPRYGHGSDVSHQLSVRVWRYPRPAVWRRLWYLRLWLPTKELPMFSDARPAGRDLRGQWVYEGNIEFFISFILRQLHLHE